MIALVHVRKNYNHVVDVYVGKEVFEKGVINFLKNRGKTIIFVTNDSRVIKASDKLLNIENGQIQNFSSDKQELLRKISVDDAINLSMDETDMSIE
jgi:ABC-type protease/lipase transport system fused ATPase/permease subunit